MSNEIIERVAKVIFETDWEREWATAENYERYHYLDISKAAIEAMREPTDEMILQGSLAWSDVKDDRWKKAVRRIWPKIIDAALK